MFISIDGIDGGGKSTQIELLRNWLMTRGHDVLCVRDPGTTAAGEAVRDILLHREDIPLATTTEMLLYMSARAQLVFEQIRPALEAGKTVLSDRFLLANVVYQGCGGDLDIEHVWSVGQVATQGIVPNITIVLDLPPEVAMKRLGDKQDRLEKRGVEYFRKLREGYLQQMSRASEIAFAVSAEANIEAIHQAIQDKLNSVVPEF